MLADRLNDALPLAERALASARERSERGFEAYALRLLGEIASRRDPPDVEAAEGHHRGALALATELGMRPLVAHCHLGLGTLYRKIGRQEQAQAELSTAIEMYHSMEMTFWLPRAEADLGAAQSPATFGVMMTWQSLSGGDSQQIAVGPLPRGGWMPAWRH